MGLIAFWEPEFESLYHGADAQKVYNEILSIGPSATPEQIVNKARDESTELHLCFTWDDEIAAEKWRKEEARQITHHLKIKIDEQPEGVDVAPRVFVKSDVYPGYRSMELIIQNDNEYDLLVQRALGELIAFQKKYAFLSDHDLLTQLIASVSAMAKSA